MAMISFLTVSALVVSNCLAAPLYMPPLPIITHEGNTPSTDSSTTVIASTILVTPTPTNLVLGWYGPDAGQFDPKLTPIPTGTQTYLYSEDDAVETGTLAVQGTSTDGASTLHVNAVWHAQDGTQSMTRRVFWQDANGKVLEDAASQEMGCTGPTAPPSGDDKVYTCTLTDWETEAHKTDLYTGSFSYGGVATVPAQSTSTLPPN